MSMPADFHHLALLQQGRPRHRKYDDFWFRHPTMSPGHRAKLFAPFDALRGFSEAVSSKEVAYEARRQLSAQQRDELERKLQTLSRLTANGHLARENVPSVTAEYYLPCSDMFSDAYGTMGQYVCTSGTVVRIDRCSRLLILSTAIICFDDLFRLEGELLRSSGSAV